MRRVCTSGAVFLFLLAAAGVNLAAFSLVRLGLALFAASFLFPTRRP